MSDQVVLCPIGFGIALAVRKFFTSHKCDDQARSSAKLCMSDLRNLLPCHKANRNAATPFCNTGKINPICHRTTPQKVNHANSRCSAHTDAIFTKLVSMKHKYDNENDHSNDCRDHPRPSAKTGRKADDIAVCFIPLQNTPPPTASGCRSCRVNIIRGGVPPVKRAAAVSADTRAICKKAPERVLFCMFVPAHAPSFASMASQTSSMSPTMP